jgi:hypothetical protein
MWADIGWPGATIGSTWANPTDWQVLRKPSRPGSHAGVIAYRVGVAVPGTVSGPSLAMVTHPPSL